MNIEPKAPGKKMIAINQKVKTEETQVATLGGNTRIETQGPTDNVFCPKTKYFMMSKSYGESKRDAATQLTQISSPDTGMDELYRLPISQRPALDLASDVKLTLSDMAKRDFGFM